MNRSAGERQIDDDDALCEEVEITPSMVEAGFAVLAASGIADEYLEADSSLVVEIYQAMDRIYRLERTGRKVE